MRIGDAQSTAAPAIAASGTFTHAYQNAGTYSPKFTVSNSSGSAQTSATVTVGPTAVCLPYIRSCPAGTHNGGQCNQDCIPDNTSTTFSASPTSGPSPLNVNFSYPYNSTTSGGQYTVNFGDGTSGQMTPFLSAALCAFGSDCTQRGSWSANHIYNSAGTYTASLMQSSFCALDSTCWVPALGVPSVTITVTGGGSTCGDRGCVYWVPPSTYPNTSAPSQGGTTQVSTAGSDSSGRYWCSAGAVSVVQSTPCSSQ